MRIAWWWGIMVCLLAGCQSIPNQSTMTPEQIKAYAGDNKGMVQCGIGPTPWGNTRWAMVTVDETSASNVVVTLKGDCSEIGVTTTKPGKAAP